MSDLNERQTKIRATIEAFITARRDAKLKGKEDDAKTAAKYDYATWLADAARRVSQIQAVTHILKATHPDARGTSLHVSPDTLPRHQEVGTHTLGTAFAEDVVGNAAALDVFKFLKLEVDGHSLLYWLQQGDPDLLQALDPDPAIARRWAHAFAGLIRTDTTLVSHTKAKQLYWLTGDDPADDSQYHLLQPLFSSSLAQAVYEDIRNARYGDENKAARQARRDRKAHDGVYIDYRNLIVRKLGGTKPQNISQLNSERGGMNYLLSSLPPPRWERQHRINVRTVESAMDGMLVLRQVRMLIKELAEFLKSDPPPNKPTRRKRAAIEQALGAQLPMFAERIKQQMKQPGWTRSDCRLALCEQLWLDPERAQLEPRTDPGDRECDLAFIAAYAWGDWPDQVAGRFANWLNVQLRQAGLKTVGAVEAKHWAKQAIMDTAWPVPQRRSMGELA